ncbi:FG-GAP-like repeat-containing protein [Microbacterium sp. CJ88]|uniref:FG-GAP-like repeat-containing protein n=1 Tax=Microbacterium sp. CJ88 TaxID=3445672 RepID=UPI003F65E794
MSPHHGFRLRARALTVLLVALLAAGAALAPSPAVAAGGTARQVFDLTNAERAKAGLAPLVSNAALDAAAGEWARYLASSCTFAHSSSAWRDQRTIPAGWKYTGENIAAGQDSPPSVMAAWMASAGHRANILDSRYTGLGVGFATGTCYRTYWVQIFGVGSPTQSLPGGAGDIDGDGSPDVLALTSTGDLMVYTGNGAASWKGSSTVASGWSRGFTTLGDFTGDGRPDIARVEANGDLMLVPGDGRGGYAAATRIGNGWGMFSQLIGGIDFNGDRKPDVIGRTPGGDLYLYVGDGAGGWLGGGYKIGNGWSMMDFVFYAGDFNGDGRGDIIARQPNGTLWLYPTTGDWGWGTPRAIGYGWHAFTSIFSAGDFDGNGTSDVLARTSDGTLLLYGGDGSGGWISGNAVGWGWSGMRQIG